MQLPFQLFDQMADAATETVDNDVGDFAVKRITHCKKFLDLLHRIIDLQQGPVMIQAGALEQQSRCGVKINNYASLFQRSAIVRPEYGPATGGNDQVGLAAQLGNDLCLALPESLLALNVENQGNSDTGAGLYFLIGIEEGTVHAPCQLATNRRLSCAGHANQIDIALCTHAPILAAHPSRQDAIAGTPAGGMPYPRRAGTCNNRT